MTHLQGEADTFDVFGCCLLQQQVYRLENGVGNVSDAIAVL